MILNSAAGVTLPLVYAPPIRTICLIFGIIAGSIRIAIARLVIGPVVTIVISPSDSIRVLTMKSTACSFSNSFVSGGKTGPSSPVSPWISPAIIFSRTIGCPQPAYTGTSTPSHWHTFLALICVFSSVWLPATTVIPNRSILSLFAASVIATASSCPGSQSRIIFVFSI